MKNFFLSIISFVIPISIFGQGLVEHTFLDFNTFEEQIQEGYPNPDNQLLSVDGEAIAEIGSEMFMLDNWNVAFTNSSGENKISQNTSYSKRIDGSEQGTVLGIRANFPDWPYAGEAYIKPHFPLLPFSRVGEYMNINNGVVTNVGHIKTFSTWVSGRNFPFSAGIRVSDITGKIREFPLGSLKFVGWRKLVYNNPFFSDRPINNLLPSARIYPSEVPLLKFEQISIYKPPNHAGKDFVGYFGSMSISYTPFITEFPTDINDENTWGIIRAEQVELGKKINHALYDTLLQYEYAKQRAQQNNEDANNENQ